MILWPKPQTRSAGAGAYRIGKALSSTLGGGGGGGEQHCRNAGRLELLLATRFSSLRNSRSCGECGEKRQQSELELPQAAAGEDSCTDGLQRNIATPGRGGGGKSGGGRRGCDKWGDGSHRSFCREWSVSARVRGEISQEALKCFSQGPNDMREILRWAIVGSQHRGIACQLRKLCPSLFSHACPINIPMGVDSLKKIYVRRSREAPNTEVAIPRIHLLFLL